MPATFPNRTPLRPRGPSLNQIPGSEQRGAKTLGSSRQRTLQSTTLITPKSSSYNSSGYAHGGYSPASPTLLRRHFRYVPPTPSRAVLDNIERKKNGVDRFLGKLQPKIINAIRDVYAVIKLTNPTDGELDAAVVALDNITAHYAMHTFAMNKKDELMKELMKVSKIWQARQLGQKFDTSMKTLLEVQLEVTKKEIEYSEIEVAENQERSETLYNEVKRLNKQIATMKVLAESSKVNEATLKNALAEMDTEALLKVDYLKSIDSDHCLTLQQGLDQIKEELRLANSSIEKLEEQKRLLDSTVRDKEEEKKRLEQELRRLQGEANVVVAARDSEIEFLGTGGRVLYHELESMELTNETLGQIHEGLDRAHNALDKEHDGLVKDQVAIKAELEAIQRDFKYSEEKITELEATEKIQAEVLERTIRDKKLEVERLEQELRRLQGDANAVVAARDSEIDVLKTGRRVVDGELQSMELANQTLEQTREGLAKEHEALVQAHKDLDKEHNVLVQNHKGLDEKNKDLVKDQVAIKAKFEAAQCDLRDRDEKIEKLEKALQEKDKRNQLLVGEAQQKCDDTLMELKENRESLVATRAALGEQYEKTTETEADLEETKKSKFQMERSLQDTNVTLRSAVQRKRSAEVRSKRADFETNSLRDLVESERVGLQKTLDRERADFFKKIDVLKAAHAKEQRRLGNKLEVSEKKYKDAVTEKLVMQQELLQAKAENRRLSAQIKS